MTDTSAVTWLRTARRVWLAVVVLAPGWALHRLDWQTTRSYLTTLRGPWLTATAMAALGSHLCRGSAWWASQRAVGQAATLGETLRHYLIANLGKYVPGSIWQVTTAAWLTRRANRLSPLQASATFGILLVATQLVGAALAMPDFLRNRGVVVLFGLALAVAGAWLVLVSTRVGRWLAPLREQPLKLVIVIGWSSVGALVSWALLGLSMLTTQWALRPPLTVAPEDIIGAIRTMSASGVAGFLAVFAPAGVGVREMVMVDLLRPDIGLEAAVVVATVHRIVLTLVEILAAAFCWRRPR